MYASPTIHVEKEEEAYSVRSLVVNLRGEYSSLLDNMGDLKKILGGEISKRFGRGISRFQHFTPPPPPPPSSGNIGHNDYQ